MHTEVTQTASSPGSFPSPRCCPPHHDWTAVGTCGPRTLPDCHCWAERLPNLLLGVVALSQSPSLGGDEQAQPLMSTPSYMALSPEPSAEEPPFSSSQHLSGSACRPPRGATHTVSGRSGAHL